MELLEHGGWTLISIVALSSLGWWLIIRKWIHVRIKTVNGFDWIEPAMDRFDQGSTEELKSACRHRGELIGRMVLSALDAFESGRGFSPKHRKAIEERETIRLRKHLNLISTTGAVLPLLGLLGTVLGMMKTFGALTMKSSIGANSLMAGGVSEALVTTQAGLVASLPIVLMYGILSSRIRRYMEGCALVMKRMESVASEGPRSV